MLRAIVLPATAHGRINHLWALDWQTTNQDSNHPIVSTTAPGTSDIFFFDLNNFKDFHAYLSLVTFTGNASENEGTNI